MSKPKGKKYKAPAIAAVPSDKIACAAQIKRIGDIQRNVDRLAADMNDEIAAITAKYQPDIEAARQQLTILTAGVQAWCEANRDELTEGRKVKTANLITGEIAWRVAPPSVKLTNVEAVLKTLRRLDLVEFIRTKEEVDKDAILANHAAAPKITTEVVNNELDIDKRRALLRTLQANELLQGLSGIKIVSDVEGFSISPFEQQAEVAA